METSGKINSDPVREKLHFIHLPLFAEYILKNKLEDFVRVQLRLAISKEVPLLKLFDLSKYTEEQLVQMSVPGYTEFLNYAINNKLDDQIERSMQKWVTNQLPNITSDQLVVDDLTLSTYLRKNGFYEFIPDYTSDVKITIELVKEIEEYSLAAQSKGFQTYISISQEKLSDVNAQLTKHKEKLLEAQEIANIGSFEWDLTSNGNSDYSPQMYRIFEMERTTNLDDFFTFVHPEDKVKLALAIDKALHDQGDYDCEYRYIVNGKQKIIWSRGKLIKKDGKPFLLRGTIMDITDRHYILQDLARLNHSLDQKNKELKRSNEELTSFSYAASHDLQEPLRKVKTFSSILMEKEYKNLSEDGKMYLDKIDSSTMRMQKLIQDLLAFSRTQTNIDSKQKTNLNTIIDHISHSYEDMISDKRLIIKSGNLPELFAVPFLLQQLFENVIGNSIKYRKQSEQAIVEISSEIVKASELNKPDNTYDFHRISVKDNGIGFKNEYAEKIFEIFHRLHGKAEYSGTGIGLAICKKIVENHDGFITAEGEPGVGATFRIYFPILQS
ncbi:MAG: histidine kinase [Bacteroidetes bacterium]|nr:histidine kinase [Bacteroidota bacterium]